MEGIPSLAPISLLEAGMRRPSDDAVVCSTASSEGRHIPASSRLIEANGGIPSALTDLGCCCSAIDTPDQANTRCRTAKGRKLQQPKDLLRFPPGDKEAPARRHDSRHDAGDVLPKATDGHHEDLEDLHP